MLRGDISNQRSLVFGFRCEGTLLKYKDDNLIDKALNLIIGKSHRAEVDKDVLSMMNYIYWNTEYTVLLVIDKENYTEEAKVFLEELPYNQVALILNSVNEVTMMLNTGEMTYYIDNTDSSRYKVQSKYAIPLSDLNTILKKNYGRFDKV